MKHYVIVIGDDDLETEALSCADEDTQQRIAKGERERGHSILFLSAEGSIVDVDGPYGPTAPKIEVYPPAQPNTVVEVSPDYAKAKEYNVDEIGDDGTLKTTPADLLAQAETILKNGDQCVSIEAKVGAMRHAMQLMTEAIFIAISLARG